MYLSWLLWVRSPEVSVLTGTPVAPQPGTALSLLAVLSPQELGSGLDEGLAAWVWEDPHGGGGRGAVAQGQWVGKGIKGVAQAEVSVVRG